MDIKRIKMEFEPEIKFYDGTTLNDYKKLYKRWDKILEVVHQEIYKYVNNENLCFDEELFPSRNRLTGNYYITSVSYIMRIKPNGFQIMVTNILTESFIEGEDDYLGLEITMFLASENGDLEVLGVDSFSI